MQIYGTTVCKTIKSSYHRTTVHKAATIVVDELKVWVKLQLNT